MASSKKPDMAHLKKIQDNLAEVDKTMKELRKAKGKYGDDLPEDEKRDILHQFGEDFPLEDYYKYHNIIGKGGQSDNVSEYHLEPRYSPTKVLQEKIAVKKLKALLREEKAGKFKQEIESVKKAEHPNIVHYLGCVSKRKNGMVTVKIIMEKCQTSLSDIVDKRGKKFSMKETKNLADQILNGMKHLHGREIAHKDINPNNILINFLKDDGDLSNICIKIADFGMARDMTNHELSTLVTTGGFPGFMPPEVVENFDASKPQTHAQPYKIDIYAFGLILIFAYDAKRFGHLELAKMGKKQFESFIERYIDERINDDKLKEALKLMLKWDRNERPSTEELTKLDYFKSPDKQVHGITYENYNMEKILGKGYFATTYLGKLKSVGESPKGVVIKTFADHHLAEADLKSWPNHENLVNVLGYEKQELAFHVFIELMEDNLTTFVASDRGQSLHSEQVESICLQLAKGLKYLHHDADVPHGNLKPDNIFIQRDGSGHIAKVGEAFYPSLQSALWINQQSLMFMAPELITIFMSVVKKRRDKSLLKNADLFSLGLVFLFVDQGEMLPIQYDSSTNSFTKNLDHLKELQYKGIDTIKELCHTNPGERLSLDKTLARLEAGQEK